jgi:tetratricopeptide (TPR) repeat protein
LATEAGDLPVQIGAHLHLALAYHNLGDYRQAIRLFSSPIERLTGSQLRERFGLTGVPAAICRSFRGWSLAECGDFPESLASCREGLEIASRVDQPYTLLIAHLWLGMAHLRKGELQLASEALGRAAMLVESAQLHFWFPWVASGLGVPYVLTGRVGDGIALLETAVERGIAMGLKYEHAARLTRLATGYLSVGRTDEAMARASEALTEARLRGERGHEAQALHALGEVTGHVDRLDPAAAENHCRASLAIATELGMRPLVAHCHLGLGQIFQRAGKTAEARARLTTATAMYREMGMSFWLEKADAALGPPHRSSP